MRVIKKVFAAVLFITIAGCGKTQVKVVNSTNNNFGVLEVVAKESGKKVTYTEVKKATQLDTKDWVDDNALTVTVTTASPSTTDVTGGVLLKGGELNVITLINGSVSSEIKYSVTVSE